jgi:hypothetical protein
VKVKHESFYGRDATAKWLEINRGVVRTMCGIEVREADLEWDSTKVTCKRCNKAMESNLK